METLLMKADLFRRVANDQHLGRHLIINLYKD